jgi:hypothetical protein
MIKLIDSHSGEDLRQFITINDDGDDYLLDIHEH